MQVLFNWLASAFIIIIASYLLPGVHVASFWTALGVALVLGILNLIFKPILILLTLPINILIFGLFTIVINAFLVLLASKVVPGFNVAGFWSAVMFSLLISLINIIFSRV
ncbi:MAG TPA: phage holin family protein [Patescibacteria group bacterium]